MRTRETWADLFRGLGQSVIEVIKAEFSVLGEDWKKVGKQTGILFGLVVVCLGIVVAIIQIGMYASVHGLAALTGWDLWLTGFIVCFAGLLIIALIGTVAYFMIIRKLESPVASARRRMDDHFSWWQQQFYAEDRSLGGFDEHEETGSGPSGDPTAAG